MRAILTKTAGLLMLAIVVSGVGWVVLKAQRAKNLSGAERARRLGQPIPVRTELVSTGSFEQVIGATAVTDASETASIWAGPAVGIRERRGVIEQIHFVEGQHVERGRLLFELEDRLLAEVVKQKTAAWATALAEFRETQRMRKDAVASAVLERDLRKAELDAYLQLKKDRAATALQVQNAELQFKLAQHKCEIAERKLARVQREIPGEGAYKLDDSSLASADQKLATISELDPVYAKVALAQLELLVARRDLKNTQLKAPIDGFVSKVAVVLGEQVSSAKEFARIVRLDPIHIRVDYPQERVDDVFLGQEADVVLDSFPQETFSAKVIRMSPRVDETTRVLAVVLEMPNPGNRIKAGISAFARLKVSKPDVTSVPATAIVHRGSKSVVFTIEDGRAQLREVDIGHSDVNSMLEVRSGLAPGDAVVVYGTESLRHDDLVNTDWKKWARRE